MTTLIPDPPRPFSIAEICCCQCGKYSPTPRVRFVCPHCGYTPRDPDETKPSSRAPKPAAAASTPETDTAIAILVALGIRAADARSLASRAATAGIHGAETIVAWCCRARTALK